MQSNYWIQGYLEGRIDWYKKNAPNEVLAIAELQELLDRMQA